MAAAPRPTVAMAVRFRKPRRLIRLLDLAGCDIVRILPCLCWYSKCITQVVGVRFGRFLGVALVEELVYEAAGVMTCSAFVLVLSDGRGGVRILLAIWGPFLCWQ
jgi:hypothetical protein